MQNQPDPDTPVHERRWLDRLRAAWDEVGRKPTNKAHARALETVAHERPEEATYRINTFAADAARRSSPTLARRSEGSIQPRRDESETHGEQATLESDHVDDEAEQ